MRILVILLLLASASAQDLHRLAGEGLVEEIRVAIHGGADPNARDAYGQTPLMYAVDHGQLEAVQALLQQEANVNAQSDAGWTPLMYSSREAWTGWVYAELLLLHGADPRLRNAEGQTARDIAKDGVRQVTLLEAAELLYEALEPGSLKGVASARTVDGYFAAGIVDHVDVVLVSRTPSGAKVLVRLREHRGVMAYLEELGIDWRYGVSELALADPNEDGRPDVLIRGGCECGAGPGFHVLFDGATGAALSIEQASLWDYAPARQPTHAYRFDDSAPGWMNLFLTGALAAQGFAPPSAPGSVFMHEGHFSLP
jgi:hypothetical protein